MARKGTLPLLAALAALALATPSPAHAANWPVVGFGEQRSSVFSNPYWRALELSPVRLVVGWDAMRYRWQRAEIDHWMDAARAANADPLIAFSRSREISRRRMLPTRGQYERWFLAFRERYPEVKTFIPWNEANHCSQPLCHRPRRAAAYFDVMESVCVRCTIVAADVLDSDGMVEWLREFRRAAEHRPRIWGLHNYLDANKFRRSGTRRMLRTVPGRIWFTETGGIVERKSTGQSPYRFPDSPSHAARATRWVLERLATMSPRIDRVYLYHFEHPGRDARWDSGVMDPDGRPRPAYRVISEYVARARRARESGR